MIHRAMRPIYKALRWILALPAGIIALLIAMEVFRLVEWIWLPPLPSRWELLTYTLTATAFYSVAFVATTAMTAPRYRLAVGLICSGLTLAGSIYLLRYRSAYPEPWILIVTCIAAPVCALITALTIHAGDLERATHSARKP